MVLRDDELLCHGRVYNEEGEYYRKECGVCVAYKSYITKKGLDKKLKNADEKRNK